MHDILDLVKEGIRRDPEDRNVRFWGKREMLEELVCASGGDPEDYNIYIGAYGMWELDPIPRGPVQDDLFGEGKQ